MDCESIRFNSVVVEVDVTKTKPQSKFVSMTEEADMPSREIDPYLKMYEWAIYLACGLYQVAYAKSLGEARNIAKKYLEKLTDEEDGLSDYVSKDILSKWIIASHKEREIDDI